MLKIIFQLIWHRANIKTWQLQIGAYLLKKGCPYELGEVVKRKRLFNKNGERAKYITGLSYDFGTNKIYKRTGSTIFTPKKSFWTRINE